MWTSNETSHLTLSDSSQLTIETDLVGSINRIDRTGATLLNVSPRRTLGRNLLTFVVSGRLQLAQDLSTLPYKTPSSRVVAIKPRDRRNRCVAILMRLNASITTTQRYMNARATSLATSVRAARERRKERLSSDAQNATHVG